MVAVAQLVEPRVVVPVVAGSSPVRHPVRVSRWLDEISTLHPERDAQRIVFLDASFEFPWDTERALELAFYRTYAVPSHREAAR